MKIKVYKSEKQMKVEQKRSIKQECEEKVEIMKNKKDKVTNEELKDLLLLTLQAISLLIKEE